MNTNRSLGSADNVCHPRAGQDCPPDSPPGLTAPQGRAFTLLELLIVIGMVALWALMLAPTLAHTRSYSPAIQCMSNLRQLQRAHATYAADYSGRLVANKGAVTTDYTSWATGWLDWNVGMPSGANTNTQYLINSALGPYTARTVGVYRCPADKTPSTVGLRVRSYSMNGFVGGTLEWTVMGYANYRVFLKDSDFTTPGPAKTSVFIDEHPDSISDELFAVRMPAAPSWPAASTWEDVPASQHNSACGISFADGHVEIHKWLDTNTLRPVSKVSPGGAYGTTSLNDSRWLVGRASAPL